MTHIKVQRLKKLGTRLVGGVLLAVLLQGCFEEEKVGVGYMGANHTDKTKVEITINGEGGIMIAMRHGYGSKVCCVMLPAKWRPDLSVTVSWEDDPTVQLDERGQRVTRNGVPVLIKAPRMSRTVKVEEYKVPDVLWIHFFPGDEIKVVSTQYWPGHRLHPYPTPEIPGVTQ